jgi:hypothetical protein
MRRNQRHRQITAAAFNQGDADFAACRLCIAQPKRTGWRPHLSLVRQHLRAGRSAWFARASYSSASCFRARSVSASVTLSKRSLRMRATCALKNLASSAIADRATPPSGEGFERSGGSWFGAVGKALAALQSAGTRCGARNPPTGRARSWGRLTAGAKRDLLAGGSCTIPGAGRNFLASDTYVYEPRDADQAAY